MRKALRAALIGLAVVAAAPPSSQAEGRNGWHGGHGWHHSSFGTGVVIGGYYGPGFLWPSPWGAFPGYAYGYGAAPYAYAPQPMIVQQQQPTYVQQDDRDASSYWYYCQNPQGYYPYVQRCSSGWMKVVPPDGPPN